MHYMNDYEFGVLKYKQNYVTTLVYEKIPCFCIYNKGKMVNGVRTNELRERFLQKRLEFRRGTYNGVTYYGIAVISLDGRHEQVYYTDEVEEQLIFNDVMMNQKFDFRKYVTDY